VHELALRRRIGGFAAAVALQAVFVLTLIWSLPGLRPAIPVRETILRLIERRPAPPPKVIDARPPPAAIPAPVPETAPAPPGIAAPPDALRGFGEALNGCAPENYASLTPEMRARCARPGEGLVVRTAPDLMGEKSHAKDEAYWREKYDEAHWQPGLCQPVNGIVAFCLMNQTVAENNRAMEARTEIDNAKTKAMRLPAPPIPPAR